MAHLLIHSLRELLAPCCVPLFTSDGLNLYFYAALGSFWTMAPGGSERAEHAPVAGDDRADLWAGEEKVPPAQAGAGLPGDATWNPRTLSKPPYRD